MYLCVLFTEDFFFFFTSVCTRIVKHNVFFLFSWLIHCWRLNQQSFELLHKKQQTTICLSPTSWPSFLPFSLHSSVLRGTHQHELVVSRSSSSATPGGSDLLRLTSLIKTNVFADVGSLSLAVINCLLIFGKHLQPHSNLF